MTNKKKDRFYGLTPSALENYFSSIGENTAKARTVFDYIYRKGKTCFSDLPFSERLIKRMTDDLSLSLPEIVSWAESEDYVKLLLKLEDGEYVESVLMRQKFGAFVCVSTQVGCNMGCAFCCSGKMKKVRDLTAAEIVGQLIVMRQYSGERIQGVSVMGIGEPFDNYQTVMDFINIATAPVGLEIAKRRITVSTCGIVPQIYSYADDDSCCNLAISLHAPNDEIREELMPINKAYPLNELIKAAEYFSLKNNSRVTLEYVMLKNINDSPTHAQQLSDLIEGRKFYVNIIPYNPTENDRFERTEFDDIMLFYDVLKKNGVNATIRREFGTEAKAACGQLSSDYKYSR